MRNGNFGKYVLMKLLMEHEEILYDFLQCTNVKKFVGVRKEDVCFGECEVVEYLPDDCYNFRFKVQCKEKKTQDHVYVAIIESNALMGNDIVNLSLKSSFDIVDQHAWDEWTGDEEGMKIRELWCTMNMAYPAIFDDSMDALSGMPNEKMVQTTFLKFSLDQHWMGDGKKPLEVQQIYYVVFLLINSKEDYEKYKKMIKSYQQ